MSSKNTHKIRSHRSKRDWKNAPVKQHITSNKSGIMRLINKFLKGE